MNQYEIALVVSAQLTDEDRAAVVEQVKNYIGQSGHDQKDQGPLCIAHRP